MSAARTAVNRAADSLRNGAMADWAPVRSAAVASRSPGSDDAGRAGGRRVWRRTHQRQGSDGMAIGPVQLIVLGFDHPDFRGEIIDPLAVYKDADGELEVQHLSNLSTDEAIEFGSTIGALIGLGIEGEEGAEAGALAGAEAMANGVDLLAGEEWDVLEDIPPDSAAALILVEHHWAIGLRDAVARAGGSRLGDAFISPLDLVEIGLLAAHEKDAHALETPARR